MNRRSPTDTGKHPRTLSEITKSVDFALVSQQEAESFDTTIAIDEDHLDAEWLRQPTLRSYVGRIAARSRMAVGKLRGVLKVRSSELYLQYKREGIEGIGRITDEAIKSAVAIHPDIQRLEYKLNLLQAIDTYVSALTVSCDHRVVSLKWLSEGRTSKNVHTHND